MSTMASNTQFEKDHSELDPRVLVDPQTSTGMPPVSGGDQRRIRLSTGVESDDQALTRGMDPDGTSQPGRELKWSCPGCRGKPGNTPPLFPMWGRKSGTPVICSRETPALFGENGYFSYSK